jgi:hypothetical protein
MYVLCCRPIQDTCSLVDDADVFLLPNVQVHATTSAWNLCGLLSLSGPKHYIFGSYMNWIRFCHGLTTNNTPRVPLDSSYEMSVFRLRHVARVVIIILIIMIIIIIIIIMIIIIIIIIIKLKIICMLCIIMQNNAPANSRLLGVLTCAYICKEPHANHDKCLLCKFISYIYRLCILVCTFCGFSFWRFSWKLDILVFVHNRNCLFSNFQVGGILCIVISAYNRTRIFFIRTSTLMHVLTFFLHFKQKRPRSAHNPANL